MTIRDLLAAESINLNGTPAGKTEALNQCIDLMAKSGCLVDRLNIFHSAQPTDFNLCFWNL